MRALAAAGVAAQLGEVRRQLAEGSPCDCFRALHFAPPGVGHAVTAVYGFPDGAAGARGADSGELRAQRAELHRSLGLPLDRPAFRPSNALAFGAGGGAGGPSARLVNVHEGLRDPGVGGRRSLVDGEYEYCHYMQDRFDDNGWGCAYRSLQTICSWFRRQHYTAAPVPTHREIQETLVRIGDKDPGFVGSRQWIGSFELSYILDDLLDVACKVITVAAGADIPSKAREFAHHFETQGTPIMIGGGVLAYTLLGIDFNESTGDCAFLILDPHYTGGEDLGKIHAGQWVAWKKPGDRAAAGGDLFVRDAFYNFLCPQRPKAAV